MLGWALTRLRPDQLATLEPIPAEAWTRSTAWRPMLALASLQGYLAVPDLPQLYRRRAGEPVGDNLCGLWAVGPSTLYRYLEKARRQLLALWALQPPAGETLLSLRSYVHSAHQTRSSIRPEGLPSTNAWHAEQAQLALQRDAPNDALWHLAQAGRWVELAATLQRHAIKLAGGSEVDALLIQLRHRSLPIQVQLDLMLAEAPLWRFRHDEARELSTLQAALRLADAQGQSHGLGRANAALALCDVARDPERAIARYEVALEQLLAATHDTEGADHEQALGDYAHTLVYLAWSHLRRNDPKAKPLLAQVVQLRDELGLPDAPKAFLELALGEQCRCEGHMDQALAHRHRALLMYEQLGDRRAVINCHNNLCALYAQTGERQQALNYGQQVLAAAQRYMVEPEIVGAAHGNMAMAYVHSEEYDAAIAQFQAALQVFNNHGMRRHSVAANLNLAETHYKRYRALGVPEDETLGDEHTAQAQSLAKELNLPNRVEAIGNLKRSILGATPAIERLLPAETAAHPRESFELDRLRADLAIPRPAAQRAHTHLAIARQYLLIAAKEREAARALIAKHNVPDDFSAEFEALRQAWERELTREQALAAAWREKLGDLMSDAQRRAVVAHVLAEGFISKSGYASVAQVSPATASKHLGLLAERGLLLQIGNGPSTRYVLALAVASPEN